MNMKIYLNPSYALKKEHDCVLLLGKSGIYSLATDANLSFTGVIHPLHAIILSFIKGDEENNTVKKISQFLKVDETLVKKFIHKLLDNPLDIGFNYNGYTIGFPKNLITSIEPKIKYSTNYDPYEFLIDEKPCLKYKRHNTVSSITLMLNNICTTSCYYCYANKNNPMNCNIPFQRIKELVDEAKKLNVISFDLIGGEVFLYPYWHELIKYLINNGFFPFVSTKKILTDNEIEKFSELNLPLQISLDSLLHSTLYKTLKVNLNYVEEMKDMILKLEKKGIKIAIHTVLNQYNTTIEDMQSLFIFLKNKKNIIYWKPDIANDSIYVNHKIKGSITPTNQQLENLYKYFKDISKKSDLSIKYEGIEPPSKNNEINNDLKEKLNLFLNRAYCAGNFSQLFILPDGNVTICEELYWHKKFIIGNVKENSLDSIWNSDKALSLYNIKQKNISPNSKCHNCKIFTQCRSEKQICYRDIIRKYGVENWDLPDINCPI